MRQLLLPSAALALVLQAGAAAAQAGMWTGPYVGGSIGYSGQPNDEDETILFDRDLNGSFGDTVTTSGGANAFQRGFCGGAAESVNVDNCADDDGSTYGLHAGYDFEFGGFVLGGLVDYGRSDIEDSVTAFSSTPALYTFTRRLRNSGSIRARAGMGFGNALVYGTGGVAFGEIEQSFTTSNTVNTFTESDGGESTRYGYRVGAGLEYRFTPSLSVGAQYLYTSFKDDDFRVRAGGANVPVSNPFILGNTAGTDFRRSGDRFNMHNVSLVASFRF